MIKAVNGDSVGIQVIGHFLLGFIHQGFCEDSRLFELKFFDVQFGPVYKITEIIETRVVDRWMPIPKVSLWFHAWGRFSK